MPQLLPFFFTNQIVVILAGLGLLIYITSKYLLPTVTEREVARVYITKL